MNLIQPDDITEENYLHEGKFGRSQKYAKK